MSHIRKIKHSTRSFHDQQRRDEEEKWEPETEFPLQIFIFNGNNFLFRWHRKHYGITIFAIDMALTLDTHTQTQANLSHETKPKQKKRDAWRDENKQYIYNWNNMAHSTRAIILLICFYSTFILFFIFLLSELNSSSSFPGSIHSSAPFLLFYFISVSRWLPQKNNEKNKKICYF